jgi:hypothetical protein
MEDWTGLHVANVQKLVRVGTDTLQRNGMEDALATATVPSSQAICPSNRAVRDDEE